MSCDICGRGSCCPSFHSIEEQKKYEDVIELFDKARDLRDKIRADEEEDEEEEEDEMKQKKTGFEWNEKIQELTRNNATDHIEDVRGMVPVALWEGSEEWEQLAYELCCEECDDPHQLIWEGGPIPEPWGERWQKYEGDAKRMIEMVRKYVRPADCPRCAEVIKERDEFESCLRDIGFLVDFDHNGGLAEKVEEKLAALEAENARLNNRRADGYLYEIPITGGTYNTHYSPRKPTDVRCLNVREVFSNDAN